MVLPARPLDVTVYHAPFADTEGNVFIGRQRELATLTYGSAKTFVTVEKIVDANLFESEATAAGALPAFYFSGIAEAERGAWPLGLTDVYDPDGQEQRRYVQAARTPEGFAAYLADHGLAERSAA
jgi:glutaconate CoA-transferase subunit A